MAAKFLDFGRLRALETEPGEAIRVHPLQGLTPGEVTNTIEIIMKPKGFGAPKGESAPRAQKYQNNLFFQKES